MNNFLPERIYERVRDWPGYLELDDFINRAKETEDIVEFALADGVLVETHPEKLGELEAIIAAACPEYLLQYRVMHMESAAELKAALAEATDAETRLMIYQELYSLQEADYEDWIGCFLAEYREASGGPLSAKLHLEYLLFSGYRYRRGLVASPTAVADFLTFLDAVIAPIQGKVPADTLAQMRLHQLSLFLADLCRVEQEAAKAAALIKPYTLKPPPFDRRRYSYHVMEFCDRLFEIHFAARDFAAARRVATYLVAYINRGLADKKQLIAGLNFYDFNYALPFLALLAKYRQLGEAVPALGVDFANLTDREEAFIAAPDLAALATESGIEIFRAAAVADDLARRTAAVRQHLEGNHDTYAAFNMWLENYQADRPKKRPGPRDRLAARHEADARAEAMV
ncbi:MAG: hypothetical protein P4N59_18140 [Negativicutes bacterium]|nr:hypothetical protein [Negativicutes bacterium]